MLMQMDCLVSPSELAKNGLFLSSRSEGECGALELYLMHIYVSIGMYVVYLLLNVAIITCNYGIISYCNYQQYRTGLATIA